MESKHKLPPGWIKVKSKSREGMYYFYNEKTKEAVWKLEHINLSPEKRAKMKSGSPPKKSSSTSNLSAKSITIAKKNIAENRMKNLKMALEKERKEETENTTKPKQLSKVSQPKLKSPEKIPRKRTSEIKLISPRKRVEEKYKSEPEIESMDVEMISLSQEMKSKNDNPEDYVEPMEWEQIDVEEVLKEVNNIRSFNSTSVSTTLMPHGISDDSDDEKFYIVVDTNIFCSNPQFIDSIKGRVFKGIGKAIIFIPYVVLCELDILKTREGNIAKAAQRGAKVINGYFSSKDRYVLGQSITDDSRELMPIMSADDRILNCAFQLKETTKKILVLTNDINLRNKAFVNNFEAYSVDMLNYADFNATGTIKFD